MNERHDIVSRDYILLTKARARYNDLVDSVIRGDDMEIRFDGQAFETCLKDDERAERTLLNRTAVWCMDNMRVKAKEPELVPWKGSFDVPSGHILLGCGNGEVYSSLAVVSEGIMIACLKTIPTSCQRDRLTLSLIDWGTLFQNWLHSVDSGKTWNRCGKAKV